MNWYKKSFDSEGGEKNLIVSHAAIVLNDAILENHKIKPSDQLLHYVSHLIPEGWEKKASHIVLHDGEAANREDIGKEVIVTATGMGINGEVLAISVRVSDDQACEEIIDGHVVIAVNNRTPSRNPPDSWMELKEVIDEDGGNMSEFTVVGYISEVSEDGEVLFDD